jgi:hypothetical protein
LVKLSAPAPRSRLPTILPELMIVSVPSLPVMAPTASVDPQEIVPVLVILLPSMLRSAIAAPSEPTSEMCPAFLMVTAVSAVIPPLWPATTPCERMEMVDRELSAVKTSIASSLSLVILPSIERIQCRPSRD